MVSGMSAPETASPPRRMAPAERRRHLVDTAFEIFAAARYEDVGLEEIAAAAGVRRGLIYHYFPGGKAELFEAVFREAVTRAIAAIDSDPERSRDQKLTANLRMFLDLAERNDPIYSIYREGRRVNNPGFETFLGQARAALASEMAFNNLGTREPGPRALLALEGFAVYAETVIETWAARRDIERAEVEDLLAGVLEDVLGRAA